MSDRKSKPNVEKIRGCVKEKEKIIIKTFSFPFLPSHVNINLI